MASAPILETNEESTEMCQLLVFIFYGGDDNDVYLRLYERAAFTQYIRQCRCPALDPTQLRSCHGHQRPGLRRSEPAPVDGPPVSLWCSLIGLIWRLSVSYG